MLSPGGTGHQLGLVLALDGFPFLLMRGKKLKERERGPCVKTSLEAAETSCCILLLS